MNKIFAVIGYVCLLVVTLYIVGLWLDHRNVVNEQAPTKTIDDLWDDYERSH